MSSPFPSSSTESKEVTSDSLIGGPYDPESFSSRKKRYALDLCAVCDSNHLFTYAMAGWPNPVHDARNWASTAIVSLPESWFSPGEYLLGDSAYPCSDILIPPFKKPLANQRLNKRFNYHLSNIRVDIEHAFGVLKGRWVSLCGLRVRISTEKRYRFALQCIMACVVLHNLLIRQGDDWEEEKGWRPAEQVEEHDSMLQGLRSSLGGAQRRERMKAIVLSHHGIS